MAATIASTLQQMSMSFGLACGSLIAGWYLGRIAANRCARRVERAAPRVPDAGRPTILSSLSFWTLRANDGENVSRGAAAPQVDAG